MATCRTCGCTDERACEGGCFWVEPDRCSACATPSEIYDLLTEQQRNAVDLVVESMADVEEYYARMGTAERRAVDAVADSIERHNLSASEFVHRHDEEPEGFVDADTDGGHAND